MSTKSSTAVAEVKPAKPSEKGGASETSLVGRFGSFLLAADESFKPPHFKTLKAIASSLEEDPRVATVHLPDQIEDAWCLQRRIYPSPAENEGLVSGHDALYMLHFSDIVSFSVTVPEKNQPLRSEDDKVPTNYNVVWNGMLALVTWRTHSSSHLPLSGGHIVMDILNDALERLDLRLYIQGCNPGCTHKFAHTDIRFVSDLDDQDDIEYIDSDNWAEVTALTPAMSDSDIAEVVFLDVLGAAREFTVLKNLGRRILEAEADGRGKLSALMQTNYTRARIPTLSFVQRIKARWATRTWLRSSRFLIARVWLTLSNIELLRREWDTFRFDFEESSDERGKRKLFERDYADEVDRVQS